VICPPLEIPNQLPTALETGELVIFAGAGVSMGSPAGLPSYWSLARQIALQVGAEPLDATTPPDRFLARLKKDGHNVHEVCRSVVRASSVPNEYHKLLLRLFAEPGKIRIVTSNFDPLFSTAAAELGMKVPVYHAPALPLGNDFTGIVHLHGSAADTSAERLVLTADDFGQAYLTRGWARRFLLDLYSRYTVLFVGYSHDDIPLQYLAFGLRSTGAKPRFVLDHQLPEKWADFGITPILYVREPESLLDPYVNLKTGLRAWVAEVERKPLDVESRLDQVLNTTSAPSPEEEDFLLRALNETSSANHFARYAQNTGLRWVEWLDAKGELRQRMHLDAARAGLASHAIARWIGRQLAQSQDGCGLSLIERHEERVGDIVWDSICWELARAEPDLLSSQDGQQWATFLLNSANTTRNWFGLNHLLSAGSTRKLWPLVVRLFEALTMPTAKLFEVGPANPYRRAELSVTLLGDMQNLILTWQESIVPALSELAPRLAPILEARINQTHETAVLAGNANSFNDPAIHARERIEFDEHPAFARGVHLLMSFFAQTLDAIQARRRGAVEDWCDRLVQSDNPILVRFGLYLLRRCDSLSPSAKLAWLVDRSLLYPPAYSGSRESYEVLKLIYGNLTPVERESLWTALDAALPPPQDETIQAALCREDVDRVCWHLAKENPFDPSAIAAAKRVEKRNPRLAASDPWLPGQFMRDVSGPVGEASPRSVADLLAQAPVSQLEFLLAFRGEHWPRPARAGLLGAVAAAARENHTWGANLLHALYERTEWTSDLWYHLFWSLRYPDLSSADQSWFLAEAAPHLADASSHLDALARFLFHGQTVEELRSVGREELRRRIAFSAVLWAAARKALILRKADLKETEWVNTAINRAPGWIVEFWFLTQQLVAERTDDGEATWPEELLPALRQITSGETHADLLGLAVLFSRLPFVHRSAAAWTRSRLYPCLDFQRFHDRAWVGWTALLLYASLTRDIAFELKDLLRASFGNLAQASDLVAKKFLLQVAAIAAHGVVDLQVDGWLEAFFHAISPEERAIWTRALAREVSRLSTSDRERLWRDWAKPYWTDRLARPIPPVEPAESEALLDLAITFREGFPEAATLLAATPKPSHIRFVPRELTDSDLATAHPEAFMQVLIWVLHSMTGMFLFPDGLRKLHERLPKRRGLLPTWDAYCQRLSELNVNDARDMRAAGATWFVE
jgi:hypothetical protein